MKAGVTGWKRRCAAAALSAALAACGSSDAGETDAPVAPAGFRPPPVQAPRPLPGLGQSTPLQAYIGHRPDDAVDGVAFFDRTEVANALASALTDAGLRRRIIINDGPKHPIFALPGDRIGAHGCDVEGCAAHHWTVVVPTGDGVAQVCYHHRPTTGANSRWYAEGLSRLRPGNCPTG